MSLKKMYEEYGQGVKAMEKMIKNKDYFQAYEKSGELLDLLYEIHSRYSYGRKDINELQNIQNQLMAKMAKFGFKRRVSKSGKKSVRKPERRGKRSVKKSKSKRRGKRSVKKSKSKRRGKRSAKKSVRKPKRRASRSKSKSRKPRKY
jgi:hypothetical protein